MRATATIILAAMLFVVPGATAMTFSIPQPEAPTWARPADSPSIPTELGVERTVVAYAPLGDVDADGSIDVLMQETDLASGAVVYRAVAGAGLEAEAWQIQAAAGTALDLSGDLDADGLPDHLLVQATSAADTVGQTAAGAGAQRVTAQGELAVRSVGGVAGQALFQQQIPTSIDHVRSGIQNTVAAGQERITEETGQVQAVGQDAVFSVQEHVETTRTLLLDQLPTSTLTEVQNDVTIQFLDASGTVRATAELTDPHVNVVGMVASDVDLDGVADGVLLQLEQVSPTQEHPAVRPVLTALDGATGQVAWEATFDVAAGTPMLLPPIGDLDGDGKSEVAFLEALTQAGTADPSGVVRVLSGATGEVIATAEAGQGVIGVLPLGDLDADGAAEALQVIEQASGALQVAAVDAGLRAVWELELDGQVPLNAVHDPFTGEIAGFQDWDLDGVPDVAVGTALETAAQTDVLEVAVHSGVDGALQWEGAYPDVASASIIAGASASASHDLALLQAPGGLTQLDGGLAHAEGLALTLVRGADGAAIWRLPMIAEGIVPQGTAVLAQVDSLGDIDGDAIDDLQVHLEFTAQTGAQIVDTGAAQISTAADAVGHTYVLSGVDGAVITSHADAAGNMSVPLQTPGPVEPLAAYRGGEAAAEEGKESPLPVVVALAAVLAAVAVLRRRV